MEEYIENIVDTADKNNLIDEMMRNFGEEILYLMYSYVKDKAIAEDLTQEVFVKCYKNLHTYKQHSKMKTWVWRIAINHCKDYLKSWYKRKVIPSEVEVALTPAREYGVEDSVIRQEEDEELVIAVMDLPIHYREVIYLFYFEEMSIKEISSVTDQNSNTVKTRLKRAKQLLKEQLGGMI